MVIRATARSGSSLSTPTTSKTHAGAGGAENLPDQRRVTNPRIHAARRLLGPFSLSASDETQLRSLPVKSAPANSQATRCSANIPGVLIQRAFKRPPLVRGQGERNLIGSFRRLAPLTQRTSNRVPHSTQITNGSRDIVKSTEPHRLYGTLDRPRLIENDQRHLRPTHEYFVHLRGWIRTRRRSLQHDHRRLQTTRNSLETHNPVYDPHSTSAGVEHALENAWHRTGLVRNPNQD
jgi:hypothetical protein